MDCLDYILFYVKIFGVKTCQFLLVQWGKTVSDYYFKIPKFAQKIRNSFETRWKILENESKLIVFILALL